MWGCTVPSDLLRQTEQLKSHLAGMGEHADACVAAALDVLESGDARAATQVIADDADRDRAYAHIQNGVLAAIALHHPVGAELRTLTGVLHAGLHVERMIDLGVSMARTVEPAVDDQGDADVVHQLLEMGGFAREVASRSVQAFLEDADHVAEEAERLDDAVDRLYASIFGRLVRLAGSDDRLLNWATRMIHLTRQFERYADHGVDVAEQAAFVRTGEPVRLRRASTA